MPTKRSFLAVLSAALGVRGAAAAEVETEAEAPKPLREREVSLNGKHLSLKEYYLELISQDAEIKKQFQKIESQYEGFGNPHYQGPGSPTVVKWFPSEVEWGHKKNSGFERFLVIHPLEEARAHRGWTYEVIFSEFECSNTHLEEDDGTPISAKAVYRFLGFRKVKLEPLAP